MAAAPLAAPPATPVLLLPPLAQLQFLLSTMMLQPLELQPLELLQLQPVVVVTGPLWPVLYRPRLVPPLQLHL